MVQSDSCISTSASSPSVVTTDVVAPDSPDEAHYKPIPSFTLQDEQKFLPPFWLMRREVTEADCNMTITQMDLVQIQSALSPHGDMAPAMKACSSIVKQWRLSVMTNMKASLLVANWC